MRIFGIDTTIDAARALISTSKEYGKISALFLAGHGSSGSVSFGTSGRSWVVADDVLKSRFSRLFTEKPAVLFISCSTGIKNEHSIVWRISEKYTNAHFYAPKVPTNISSITYNGMRDGRHIFDVEWRKKDEAAVYAEGKIKEE